MFTNGKDRFYESLMQQLPGKHRKRGGGKRKSGFRYRYANMACEYCPNHKKCPHEICPHIMDNLTDLMDDRAFIHAIENAKACDNRHKQTLLALKEKSDGR